MESEKEKYEKKIASLEAQLKEYVNFTYQAGEQAGELLSRIRSLEAEMNKYEAFWNWSRETDKMQFEAERKEVSDGE